MPGETGPPHLFFFFFFFFPPLGCRAKPEAPTNPQPDDSSFEITCITALISARCVNACGKLPRCRPCSASSSSAYSPSGEAWDSSRSPSAAARSCSPISDSAATSQNEQIRNVPSSPLQPVVGLLDAVAEHESVLGQLVGDREHRVADPLVIGRQEADQRDQQRRGVERVGLVVLAEDAALRRRRARGCRHGSCRRSRATRWRARALRRAPRDSRRGRAPPSTSASTTRSAWARRGPPRCPGRAAPRPRSRT